MRAKSAEFRTIRRRIRWGQKYFRLFFFFSVIFLSFSVMIALINYISGKQESRTWAASRTHKMAASIDKELKVMHKALDDLVVRMSYTLSQRSLTESDILKTLKTVALNHNGYFTLGVILEPYTIKVNTRLFAPFLKEGIPQHDRIDKYYDYAAHGSGAGHTKHANHHNRCKEHWYLEAKTSKSDWLIPCHDAAIGQQTLRVVAPLVVENAVKGIAFLDMSLSWLRLQVEKQSLGRNGYAAIYSEEGRLIYHGLKGLHEIIEGLSKETYVDDRQKYAQPTGVNELTGNRAWHHTAELAHTKWTLHTVIDFSVDSRQGIDDTLNCAGHAPTGRLLEENLLISKQLWIVLIIGVIGALTFYVASSIIQRHAFSSRFLWWYSGAFSAIFFMGTVALWVCEQNAPFTVLENSCIMSNRALVRSFKENYTIQSMKGDDTLPTYVPTGLFIQSIEFVNASNVTLTGYVWQQHNTETLGDIKAGIVFPEAVEAEFEEEKDVQKMDQFVRIESADQDHNLKRWYFKTTLRERFDYQPFPFDRQSVWVRLWHQDFDRNVILAPDFEAYDSLNPKALPGIEKDFILSGWKLESAFYDIRMNRYNSNFGESSYTARDRLPELYFNVELKRRFGTPFISYLFPLAIVLLMLYAILITTSNKDATKEVFGFSVTNVIASCSALFFVVIVSHVQLRDFLSSDDIVYLEYFYLITYLIILLISINSILFSWNISIRWIRFRDNLIPKLLYWPVLTFSLFCFTAYFFWNV